jgi:hypothetical protein
LASEDALFCSALQMISLLFKAKDEAPLRIRFLSYSAIITSCRQKHNREIKDLASPWMTAV